MKMRQKQYLRSRLKYLSRDQRGVVAIMLTVYLPVIVGLFSLAVDMSYVLQTRDMLQIAAESAVLAAASSPTVVSNNSSCSSDPNSVCAVAQKYAAYNMPAAQYGNVLPAANILVGKWPAGCSGSTCFTSAVPVGTSCPSCNAVKVTTQMATANGNALPLFFAQLIGLKNVDLTATAIATSASSTPPPNINFYLLLDNSPSMAIAGTPAGITTMVNNTPSQQGCAFACHESNPAADGLGNPGGIDNYQLARNLGVTLRIDLLAQAAANLMSTAATTEAVNNNTYGMAVYTFNYGLNTIYAPSGKPSTNLTAAKAAASGIQVLEVYDQNWLTSSNANNDTDTNFELAMSSINTIMPNPGGGTSATGDTPQEVLFIVSDGVDDFYSASPSACSQPVLTYSNPTKYRCQQPFSTTWCTTIKNRGIRIAVLYTEYLPLPTSTWYETGYSTFLGIARFQSQIGTNMQACASPGLFFDVQSGGDITAAMNALFQTAVATAPATLTQ
jgi:Flp pilus assembly protein TadG